MSTVTIEEAQAKLLELIDGLASEDELVITRDGQPVARLLAAPSPARKPRKAGSAKGLLTILTEDDEPLNGFEEYQSQ
jgi:antitoxin (DNA-binding transcriptional repressor) of toxin-antitoxin stability system